LNQFIATLLGLFNTKIFPIAAKADPIKQKVEFSYDNSNLNQTPVITRQLPKIKPIFIPYLFNIQLHGNAHKGCPMVNKRPFKVTYNAVMLNKSDTITFMLANVCTGMELTIVAA